MDEDRTSSNQDVRVSADRQVSRIRQPDGGYGYAVLELRDAAATSRRAARTTSTSGFGYIAPVSRDGQRRTFSASVGVVDRRRTIDARTRAGGLRRPLEQATRLEVDRQRRLPPDAASYRARSRNRCGPTA